MILIQASPCDQSKNDKIDSHKIAHLLRGGLLPQSYVYPAAMRSTRDLLRRRLHLVRKHGQLLAHIQHTRAQDQVPEFARRLAYPANRDGVAERFLDASVRKSVEVDLALLERYDSLITDLEYTLVRTAKQHDADAFHRLRSVPGIGKILALTILSELHDVHRFDRVQEFASYARLVKGRKQSGGKTLGTSGAKMGNVHLKWAFSEAAVLFLRHATGGKRFLARIEKKHGKGKALSILAHKLGRAVYYVLARASALSAFASPISSPTSVQPAALDGRFTRAPTTFRVPMHAAPLPSLQITDAPSDVVRHEEAETRARMSFQAARVCALARR